MRNKVLVIGLDGATFNLIMPWIREGKLPTLAKLIAEGVHGELESTPDMMSPSAWTSFVTGTNPGKHGIYNFLDLVPNTLKLRYLNSTNRKAKPLWTLLNETGKKTGVLNVPMTYPADPLNGFMITGWNAPTIQSKGFTHPPDLINELLEELGEYPLFPSVKKHMVGKRPDLALQELRHALDMHASASKFLQQSREWDLLVQFYIATDQVQHYFWHYMDREHPQFDSTSPPEYREAILNIFKRCDEIISEMTNSLADDTTVMIMSDHGHGRNHGGPQYLPGWLQQMGYAVEKRSKENQSVFSRPAVWAKHAFTSTLKYVYNKMNKRLSVKTKGFLNRFLPRVRDMVESTWRFSAYDWSQTRVFFHYEPRINLKGREPFGIVNPGREYEALREELIANLLECRDPQTGNTVVEEVFKGEEVYHGGCLETVPDIVIRWKDGVVLSGLTSSRKNEGNVTVTEKDVDDPRTGNHLPQGIFIARGKHLQVGKQISGAKIEDLAPTILYLMGIPVPEDMDGRILGEIFDEQFLKAHPSQYIKSGAYADSGKEGYSTADEHTVHENLRALGYLD